MLKVLVVIAVLAAAAGGAYLYISNDEEPVPVVTPPPTETASSTPTPEPSPTPSGSAAVCSATDVTIASDAVENVANLPPAVFATWTSIVDLALNCDYEALEDLALQGTGFSYSFGDDGSPASFWRAREREARTRAEPTSEYMRYLVEVLQLPECRERSAEGETYVIWPRVHCSARADADWDDLEGLYTDDEIEQMRAGDIYYGFRVGILKNGDWAYFIAGD